MCVTKGEVIETFPDKKVLMTTDNHSKNEKFPFSRSKVKQLNIRYPTRDGCIKEFIKRK